LLSITGPCRVRQAAELLRLTSFFKNIFSSGNTTFLKRIFEYLKIVPVSTGNEFFKNCVKGMD